MNWRKIAGLAILGGLFFVGCGPKEQSAANPYQRVYPMPHQYWQKNDEFYVFASGGQQGTLCLRHSVHEVTAGNPRV